MRKKADYFRKIEHADERIAELAGRQRGYVSRNQLFELGEKRHTIAHRLKVGRLIPVFAGVYAVGHLSKDPVDRAFGAVLACGSGAVLSHDSAAALWGAHRRWTTPFHVTSRGYHRREGIILHRAKLHPRDRTRQLGLPVTSPARTLLDIAPGAADKTLRRALNDLRLARYLNLGDLAELLMRCPRHPGARRLRPFVQADQGPTRSDFEDAFVSFCASYGLPTPVVNTIIHGYEADALFAGEGVIVELDGWDFHSSRERFRADRDRDATLLAYGIVTVRITWERLIEAPEREARRLARILAQRRGSYPLLKKP